MRLWGDLGLLAKDRQDPEASLGHFRQQHRLAGEVGSPLQQAITRVNIGMALRALDRPEDGRAELLQAHALLVVESPRHRAGVALTLGELALEAEQPEEAERWLEEAGADRDALRMDLPWRLALARGRLRERQQRWEEAEQAYRSGIEAVEAVRETLPRSLRTEFLEYSNALFEEWIALLTRRGAAPERLLAALERARARAFLDALEQSEREAPASEVLPMPVTEPAARAGDLGSLEPLLREPVTFLVTHCLADRLLVLRVEGERLEQRVLPVGRERLLALATEALRWCMQPPADEAGPGSSAREGEAPAGPTPLEALAEVLLEPLRDWILTGPEERPLGFVSHGPLYGVPLHALPLSAAPGTPARPLIAHRPVFYVPSLQAALRWRSTPARRAGEVLVLADSQGDLPYAEDEARAVLSRLGHGLLEVGPDATAAVLSGHGPTACYIHLAVHASRGAPGCRALIQLAPEKTVHSNAPADVYGGGGLEAALVASGQEEAGTVDSLPPGAVDAAWISRLSLTADLVVLSACESAAGELTAASEGPDLLSWSFLRAGARAVVASGWRIDDRATAQLMERFYAHLVGGMAPVVALALAQRALLTSRTAASTGSGPGGGAPRPGPSGQGAHVYYWAGFSLTGDWH